MEIWFIEARRVNFFFVTTNCPLRVVWGPAVEADVLHVGLFVRRGFIRCRSPTRGLFLNTQKSTCPPVNKGLVFLLVLHTSGSSERTSLPSLHFVFSAAASQVFWLAATWGISDCDIWTESVSPIHKWLNPSCVFFFIRPSASMSWWKHAALL